MRIIIVDDDKFVCMSLVTILQASGEVEIAAVGSNGEEAVQLYRQHRPDIALLDIRCGEVDGLEAGERIIYEFPDAAILYLTTFSDDEYIIKALRMGAKGYLIKQDIEAIVPALKAVMSGQSVFGSEIVSRIPSIMEKTNEKTLADYDISEREQMIIEVVAQGLSNKEIADKLFLSEGTVRNYLSNILNKLELRDRTQLVVFYYKSIN